MTSLQFGIAIPQSYTEAAPTVRALRAFLERADESLDSVWVQEQLMGRDHSFEPLAMLAFAAACTSRVRLCSATFIAPARNPIVFAKSVATIDQLSVGRITVGMSVGDMRTLFPASGIGIAGRAARFDEMLEVMRRFWTEDAVTLDGRFFKIENASMAPKPVQKPHPPLWFGGHSDAAMTRAARVGSGWIGAGGRSIAEFGEAAVRMRSKLRPGQEFTFAKKLYTSVGRSREEAFAGLSKWFSVHWGVNDGGAFAGRVGVYGTPRDVVDQALEAWRLGADLLILNPVFDEVRHFEVIREEIVPALREATAHGRGGALAGQGADV